MNQSIVQLIGQMLQSPADSGKTRSTSKPLSGDATQSQSADGFDAILGKTLRPASAGSKAATALTDGGQPDQAVALADGQVASAATATASPAGSSRIALIVQALLGLSEAAQVQGQPIKLPAKIDPDNPAQVAQLVKRILSRSSQAGASADAQLAEAGQSDQAAAGRGQGSGAKGRTVASPATKLAEWVSNISVAAAQLAAGQGLHNGDSAAAGPSGTAADVATSSAATDQLAGDAVELLNLARKAVLEANRKVESLSTAAAPAAPAEGSMASPAGLAGSNVLQSQVDPSVDGESIRSAGELPASLGQSEQVASMTLSNSDTAALNPVVDRLAAGTITNLDTRSSQVMRVVEFHVIDPTGDPGSPPIAASSDVVKLPAGSLAMVHDDAIIPAPSPQSATRVADISVAVASEADLQAGPATDRLAAPAVSQIRWSRQSIESGDATAATTSAPAASGATSPTSRGSATSWLSGSVPAQTGRAGHATIATPATNSSAASVAADSMTPWAQAFAATTPANDLSAELLNSASAALGGIDSLSAEPGGPAAASRPGLGLGLKSEELAGLSGSIGSQGVSALHGSGVVGSAGAASTGESFDPDVNAERIMRAMATQLNGRGSGSIRLRLDPPGLGELRIDMSLGGDGVKVTLMPSNEASAQLLSGQLHQLHDALQSRGFSIASLDVDHPQAVNSSGRGQQDRAADQSNGQQPGQQGQPGSQNSAGQGREQAFASGPQQQTFQADAINPAEPSGGLAASPVGPRGSIGANANGKPSLDLVG